VLSFQIIFISAFLKSYYKDNFIHINYNINGKKQGSDLIKYFFENGDNSKFEFSPLFTQYHTINYSGFGLDGDMILTALH